MKKQWKGYLMMIGTILILILICLPAMFISGCQPPGEMDASGFYGGTHRDELLEEILEEQKETNEHLRELIRIEESKKW